VQNISVIVPVYNGERYLAEALQCLQQQDLQPLEIVVIDDGSTDDSAALAETYPLVRCVRQDHAGLGTALNRGISEARGSLLAFLDADDLWPPNKLSLQAAHLAANPELDMVFGHIVQFHSPELTPEERERSRFPEDAVPGRLAGAMLARAEVFPRIGPLDTHWKVGQFIAWISRAQTLGVRAQVLPEVVLKRRVHLGNMGHRYKGNGDYLKILKAGLDFKRRHTQSS
jgi:glycosyltransferase involved in cell wall biosynthesis